MAKYHEELMEAARLLIDRHGRERGRLPQARVRRCISTAYYALFHFLLDDAARRIVGTHHPLQSRRRVLVRLFMHKGMLVALGKIKGRIVQPDVADFLRSGAGFDPVAAPAFARDMAAAFADAQAKRHDADYNLNSAIIVADAIAIIGRIEMAMASWLAANDAASRDFKHALALLMLQKGSLRKDD